MTFVVTSEAWRERTLRPGAQYTQAITFDLTGRAPNRFHGWPTWNPGEKIELRARPRRKPKLESGTLTVTKRAGKSGLAITQAEALKRARAAAENALDAAYATRRKKLSGPPWNARQPDHKGPWIHPHHGAPKVSKQAKSWRITWQYGAKAGFAYRVRVAVDAATGAAKVLEARPSFSAK